MITTKQTLLYLVPIQEDFALAENGKGYKLWVKQGMRFHITKVRTLKDANAKQTEFGLLGNTFGGKFIGILLLASENGGVGEKFVRKTDKNSPVVTYIAGAEDVYPNKVENILLALKNISAYQERHKGWQPGKYYSVLRALGFYNDEAFKEYKPGKLATGGIAPAGGVCAVSTGIASLLYRTENAQIIDIVHHGKESLYFQGPFSPPAEEVDSGISIRADGGFEELGFKVPKSGFLKIDILVLPSGLSHEETDPKGLSGRSDSVLLFSFSFTEEIIADQSNAISALILKFKEYRESKHGKNLDILISQDPRLFIMEKDLFANFQLVYERPNP
ncbi:MAG: hypothetical protein VB108_03520 [Anaerolineaceae bacterium]|nr:hypothetical protein [Anaerolineaceae bacterium]